MDNGRVISRADALPTARVRDEVLLIDRDAGYCYAMNSTGSRIWDLLSRPQPISLICDALCREFDVEGGICRSDVIAVLEQMERAGLIR